MMNRSAALRRILLAPPTLRSALLPRTYVAMPIHSFLLVRPASSITSITSPSFWSTLVPKPFRKSNRVGKPRSKEWNPATFFIWIFLLIGSMSIQMIALRNEFAATMRRAEAKIGLLQEVIGRIQNGEKVDVEGLLGTGDKDREREWEEVLQEIEQEDKAWEDASKRRPPTKASNDANKTKIVATADNDTKSWEWKQPVVVEEETKPEKPKSNVPRGFF